MSQAERYVDMLPGLLNSEVQFKPYCLFVFSNCTFPLLTLTEKRLSGMFDMCLTMLSYHG